MKEFTLPVGNCAGEEHEGMLTEVVARKLGIEPADLERESLQAYLEA